MGANVCLVAISFSPQIESTQSVGRFRSAETLTVKPRPVEAADAPLSRSEHFARIANSALPRFGPLGRGDPLDPVPAGDGCNPGPSNVSLCNTGESLAQVRRDSRLGLFVSWRDLQRDKISDFRARSHAQLVIDFEPMAHPAVRLEGRAKGMTVEETVYGGHGSRWES